MREERSVESVKILNLIDLALKELSLAKSPTLFADLPKTLFHLRIWARDLRVRL